MSSPGMTGAKRKFDIHVDPSCLPPHSGLSSAQLYDLKMETSHRVKSDETVIRHASWEDSATQISESGDDTDQVDGHEDRDDNASWFPRGLDAVSQSSIGDDNTQISGLTPMSSLVSTDSHTEALIRKAAREVIARMEADAEAEAEAEEEASMYDDSMISGMTEATEDSYSDTNVEEESIVSTKDDAEEESGDLESSTLTAEAGESAAATDLSTTESIVDNPGLAVSCVPNPPDEIPEAPGSMASAAEMSIVHTQESRRHDDAGSLKVQIDEPSPRGDDQDTTVTNEHEPRTISDGTLVTIEDTAEMGGSQCSFHGGQESIDMDDHYDGSASSHHSDDVFSDNASSKRSSIISLSSNQNNSSDEYQTRRSIDLKNRESLSQHDSISRKASNASTQVSTAYSLLPEPLSITSSTPTTSKVRTPNSKVLDRPPFRTPSSVRALQMSSPTPSVFSSPSRGSPRPKKRNGGSVISHLNTPTSYHKKTPTRFAKPEYPLVLLHVTVLPSQFLYAPLFDGSPDTRNWSSDLLDIKESWRLICEKLGDMVLERGILLPHPQDDFEVLSERLLEALELPGRKRSAILSCGHFAGGYEDGDPFEDDNTMTGDRWCDVCMQKVRYSEMNFGTGGNGGQRFRCKVYASNGLMSAGAWAAAWREMERVDVEIEPIVPSNVVGELDHFSAIVAAAEFECPDVVGPELPEDVVEPVSDKTTETQAAKLAEEQAQAAQREQWHRDEIEATRLADEMEELRKKQVSEQRLLEIYGEEDSPSKAAPQPAPIPEQQRPSHRSRRRHQDASLAELLIEALKVTMRDQKNILICLLSILVMFLAIRSAGGHAAGLEMLASPELALPTSVTSTSASGALPSIVSLAGEAGDGTQSASHTARSNLEEIISTMTEGVESTATETTPTASESVKTTDKSTIEAQASPLSSSTSSDEPLTRHAGSNDRADMASAVVDDASVRRSHINDAESTNVKAEEANKAAHEHEGNMVSEVEGMVRVPFVLNDDPHAPASSDEQ